MTGTSTGEFAYNILSGATAPEDRQPRLVTGVGSAAFFMVRSLLPSSPCQPAEGTRIWSQVIPTGTSIFGARRHLVARTEAPWPSVRDRLETISRYLGVTKTELKDIVGVSRQTIYEWLAGKYTPGANRMSQIGTLEDLSLKVRARLGGPLPVAVLRASRPGQVSLLDALKQNVDYPELVRIVDDCCNQVAAREARSARSIRQRLGYTETTAEVQEKALTLNVTDFTRK